jgi:hypothetical protein
MHASCKTISIRFFSTNAHPSLCKIHLSILIFEMCCSTNHSVQHYHVHRPNYWSTETFHGLHVLSITCSITSLNDCLLFIVYLTLWQIYVFQSWSHGLFYIFCKIFLMDYFLLVLFHNPQIKLSNNSRFNKVTRFKKFSVDKWPKTTPYPVNLEWAHCGSKLF